MLIVTLVFVRMKLMRYKLIQLCFLSSFKRILHLIPLLARKEIKTLYFSVSNFLFSWYICVCVHVFTKVTGANSHQNLCVVAGSAGIWKHNKKHKSQMKTSRKDLRC